jgi:hypothetical protein
MDAKFWRLWIAGSGASTPLSPGGLALEHSDHPIERMIEDAGHRYGLDEAADLSRAHQISGVSIDGRPWYFGMQRGKSVFLALSARPTQTVSGWVRRVRTMHRKKKPPEGTRP